MSLVMVEALEQDSGAALWLRWRKSSASKQFLAILKAINEAIASKTAWMADVADNTHSTGTLLLLLMEFAWMQVMSTLRLLYKCSQAGALWPALSDWLAENGNLQGLWVALAWCSSAGDDASKSVIHDLVNILMVHDLVSMTHASLSQGRLPPTLLQHPRVAEALGLALGKVLPKGFARHHDGDDLDQRMLEMKITLCRVVILAQAEPQLWQHLHLPALSLWPYLVGALRQQQEGATSNKHLQVSH